MSTVQTAVGSVIWHEQVSSAPERAQSFYTELLGWQVETWKPGEADYTMIKANDQTHGGFTKAQGDAPAGWIASVLVDDVDDTASKAENLGGTILAGPDEMPEIGRYAVLADPQGAVISAYKPDGDYPLPQGTFVWDELLAKDVDSAKRFYEQVFGWTANNMDMGDAGTYTLFNRGGDTNAAGLMQKPPGAPGGSVWVPYIATDDVDATVTKAKELGATALMEPFDVGQVGRMSMLVDPTGATFGVFKPTEEASS